MEIVVKLDEHNSVTLKEDRAEGTYEQAWLMFSAMVALGHAPENVCSSFRDIAEEIEKAWFEDIR